MVDGWERLGRRVQAERSRQGFPTAADLAYAADLSPRTLQSIEAGSRNHRPRDTTLAKIERALGWQDGSCARIVEGGRARRAPDPLLARVQAAWQSLTTEQQVRVARLVESLARGEDSPTR